MFRKFVSPFFLLILLSCGTLSTNAQGVSSSAMAGEVTDSSGALLPNTEVVLINRSTGTKYAQTTDARGHYSFLAVDPNENYTITFTHVGFAAVKIEHVTLNVGNVRTQDVKLSLGVVAEVQVDAGGSNATIDTTTSTVGGNISVSELQELPIQNRNSPAALFTLVPGYAGGSITGARTDQSSATLDAIDTNDLAAGGGIGTIIGGAPVDSIEQFSTEVAGLPPAQGTGSGGQTQLITKSGKNRFHGNINEYHRDTSTEANLWFSNNTGLPRAPIIQNQFGGNIGGPIRHDKLFFFFNFLDNRIIQSSQTVQTVPLDTYRMGEVGYINSNNGCDGNARALGNSLESSSCITYLTPAQLMHLDPQGTGFSNVVKQTIADRLPEPNDFNLGDGINTAGFRFNSPTPSLQTNYVLRIDYNMTSKNKVFGRATVNRENITASKYLPQDNSTFSEIDRSYGYVVGDTWQIGNNKVNQLYYGDTISKLSFPQQYSTTLTTTYGFGGFAGPYGGYGSQKRRVPVPEIRDDFQWSLGKHDLSFGGQFKFVKTESQLVGNFNGISVGLWPNGELTSDLRPADINSNNYANEVFDNLYTTALGHIGSTSATYDYRPNGSLIPQGQGTTRRYRFYQSEFYAGDVWKATPKLTINYGARYVLYSVPYETSGSESVQNLSFNQLFAARLKQSASGSSGDSAVPFQVYNLGGKANHGPNLYAPSYNNVAPRIGFNYAPTRQTVIRGSASIIYDRTVINAVNFIQDQSSQLFQVVGLINSYEGCGANSSVQNCTPNADNALANDTRIGGGLSGPGFPAAPTIKTPYTPYVNSNGTPIGLANNAFNFVVDPTFKTPYSITFTAGIQQELPWHLIMDLNYAGRLGRRLAAQADASQLIDFPDHVSGQLMSDAVANLENQVRKGATYKNVKPIPWFENVMSGNSSGLSNTAIATFYASSLLQRGDFADTIQSLASNGYLPSNVGLASQFAGNTFFTNKGFSSYNGLLLSLTKNLSNGLKFHFYYTFSHSIDNVSEPANNIASNNGYGYICDATRPRECRGSSDFDVRQRITGDFVYHLPIGRGRQFFASTNKALDEVIGGWSVSGIPTFDTGSPLNIFTDAFIAGYANNSPAVFQGNVGDIATHVHKTSTGAVQLFSDPTKAFNAFGAPTGFNFGSRNMLRGPTTFNFDAGLGKDFGIYRDFVLHFRADAFNVLNHPTFSSAPSLNIDAPSTFGYISSTSTDPRVMQVSLRLEF